VLQPGDLVRFAPVALPYGLDAEGLIGILGVITRCVYDAELDRQYTMVLWPDGKITDTYTDDLTLVQRARPVVE